MARWEPGARERLQAAALDLFTEQGFEKTTVDQIASRAGMNRRSFFHHFADKREVVFGGQGTDADLLGDTVREQPETAGPLVAALAGLRRTIAEPSEHYRGTAAVQVGALIAASPELQEREFAKRAHLADQIATALQERGTPEGAAAVTAWTAVAVFFVARNRWNQPGNERTLTDHMDAVAAEFLSAER